MYSDNWFIKGNKKKIGLNLSTWWNTLEKSLIVYIRNIFLVFYGSSCEKRDPLMQGVRNPDERLCGEDFGDNKMLHS